MQDLVRTIFSKRTLGIAELETNVLVLDSQLQGQRTSSKLLAAADVVVAVASFLNKWPGVGIGVSVGAILDAMDVYRNEMRENDGLVGDNTTASLVAASSDLIAGISGAVGTNTRFWPLAVVSAGFSTLSVAAKHLSIHGNTIDQITKNLEREQQSLRDSLEYEVGSRRGEVIQDYEALISQEAAKAGVDFSTVVDNGFASEVNGLIDLLDNEINTDIEKSLSLRIDLSVEQIEIIKDEYIGDFNTILGGYGDGGRVSGSLNAALGIAVKKSRTNILDTAHNDFVEEITDADLSRAEILDFSSELKDAFRQANLNAGDSGEFVDKWMRSYQQSLSNTRSNLANDSLNYKNGVLNAGIVLVDEVKKDLVQDYLDKRHELNSQYQTLEKLEKGRQLDFAHRDAASLFVDEKKLFMEDVFDMHQTSAEYLRQKAIKLAEKAKNKEVVVPVSIFNELDQLHKDINNQLTTSRAASNNVLDSYLNNFTHLGHFLSLADTYVKAEHQHLNDGFSGIISLLESIISQLEELLDEESEDGNENDQDSDNDGIPDDQDPDKDGDNTPDNHDDDSGSDGGVGGTQGDAAHEGSNNADRQRRIDPLVLDLDGDGLEFSNLDNSQVKFDLNADGFATHTSWLSGDDGFLAVDKNNDGLINNIDELFGREDKSGFEELELLDSNGDGQVSGEDTAFEQLLVWQDKNGDGVSTQDELKKLSDFNISEISLDRSKSGVEKDDVLLDEVGRYVTIDANGDRQEHLLGEVLFTTRPTYSEFVGDVVLTDAAKAIANIQGYGMMPDLNTAMSLNKVFEVQIVHFTQSLNSETFANGFDDLLFGWAGSKGLAIADIDSTPNLSPDENGLVRFANANVALSIEQLGVLKAYTGINTLELSDGIWNANGKTHTTGQLYLDAWNNIRANLVAKFAVSQGILEHLIPSVTYDAATDTLKSTFDFKSRADATFKKVVGQLGQLKTANDAAELILVLEVFDQFESSFSTTQKDRVIDLIKWAEPAAYDWLTNNIELVKKIDNSILLGSNIQGTSGANIAIGSKGHDTINTGSGNDKAFGGDGDDIITSSGNNAELDGGAGDDTLTGYYRGNNTLKGGDGDDVLQLSLTRNSRSSLNNIFEGGKGNDNIRGDYSSDTYLFGVGDGKDVIRDYGSSTDRIVFGTGISREQLMITRVGGDIVLLLMDELGQPTGDQITLLGAYVNKAYRVEELQFSDGSVITAEEMHADLMVFQGTEGDDTLSGTSLGEVIYGHGGDDTIKAGNGNNTVEGGAGSDIISTGSGNDVISGDAGDDIISTGSGNDKAFGGDGDDTITSSGNNAELYGGAGDDTLTGYYRGNNTLKGGDGDDVLQLSKTRNSRSSLNNIFEGGKGNDNIRGDYSSDTYLFGVGDGKDVIRDYGSSTDRIVFGTGISREQLMITRVGGDIVLLLMDELGQPTGDQITLLGAYVNKAYRVEELQFSDGSMMTSDEVHIASQAEAALSFKSSSLTHAMSSFESSNKVASYLKTDSNLMPTNITAPIVER